MKKLTILRCGDQLYWAYYWIAQEHAKYSRHAIKYAKWDKVDLTGIDAIYIHGPDITNYHATELPRLAMKKGIKVIGGYSGNPEYWSPAEARTYINADLIVAISPQTYAFCKFHYTNIPVIFMSESIDTEFFTPGLFVPGRFIVGWAGGIHKVIKRARLLKQLDFPVLIKSEWAGQRSACSIVTLDKMVDFYHSIDVLVLTSLSECQPRVVMEAMACGLPVIATDVGSMRMLLDEHWIVPVIPEEDTIKIMNERLKELQQNIDLRQDVGRSNLEYVRAHWSWLKNVSDWDNMFEAIVDGDSIYYKPSDSYMGLFNQACREYEGKYKT